MLLILCGFPWQQDRMTSRNSAGPIGLTSSVGRAQMLTHQPGGGRDQLKEKHLIPVWSSLPHSHSIVCLRVGILSSVVVLGLAQGSGNCSNEILVEKEKERFTYHCSAQIT